MWRIILDTDPHALPEPLWSSIGFWTRLGRTVLDARLNGCLDDLSYKLPDWCPDQELAEGSLLKTLGDLIDQQGELLLINHDRMRIGGITLEELEEMLSRCNTGPGARKDPGFDFC